MEVHGGGGRVVLTLGRNVLTGIKEGEGAERLLSLRLIGNKSLRKKRPTSCVEKEVGGDRRYELYPSGGKHPVAAGVLSFNQGGESQTKTL